jgi:hypothetical protein
MAHLIEVTSLLKQDAKAAWDFLEGHGARMVNVA